MLEFRILGPLEVLSEGEPLVLGGKRQRALLAALLVQAGRVVTTDRLLYDLWGEEPPRTASTSLHNLVSQLRKQLGAETVSTLSPGYVLRARSEQIDAGRFEASVGTARKAGPELKRVQAEILRQEAGLAVSSARTDSDEEGEIVKALLAGRVVPVLGVDGAGDLAAHLVQAFAVPKDRPVDLARISQYVATMQGSGPLYDALHDLFEVAVKPGPLHRFLARLPPLLRERGAPHQLIVSTNYDLALEQAFEDVGEELDVVTYVAAGPNRGRFWHRPPGEAPR